MIKKSEIVREAVREQDWKKALLIAKDFRIGVTQDQRSKMARAYECIVHPDFYQQIGVDVLDAIEQGKAVVKEYAESTRRKNTMMKWDVKHDKAKGIIDAALNEAEMWFTDKEKIAGLTEQQVGEVNKELTIMIESIRKRYKLQVRLPEPVAVPVIEKAEKQVPEVKQEAEESKIEETTEVVKEPEKPKRGRKLSTVEKKATAKKPRTKKSDKEAKENV